MAKLTKAQTKAHQQALEICQQDTLSHDEKVFVMENYHEGANHMNGFAGAFFTPLDLGRSFAMETMFDQSVVDICAGIGMLSWAIYRDCQIREKEIDITCIEQNHQYVEIGRKIMPEANWICGDATDAELWMELCNVENSDGTHHWMKFKQAISNPPFGNIKTGANTLPLKYKGAEFDLKIVEIGSIVAEYGTYLLPQMSTPFKYSGSQSDPDGYYPKAGRSSKYDKFTKQTGIEFAFNMGIDATTGIEWKGVSPVCEIVSVEGIHADDYEPETLFG